MTAALDLGSSAIRSLRREGDVLLSRTSRCVYAVLPDSPAHQRLLEQCGLQFTTCEEGIVLLGDGAHEHAELFKSPCQPLMAGGRLPKGNPLVRQLISALVEVILPIAGSRNEICSLTLPGGAALDSSRDARADLEFYIRLVRLQGYEPKLVPASQALILAELVQSAFTGIGIVFGASGCEAILAHRGNPICHAASDHGGEWIDSQLAKTFGAPSIGAASDSDAESGSAIDRAFARESQLAIRRQREQLTGRSNDSRDRFASQVESLLQDTIYELCDAFSAELIRSRRAKELPSPLPIVCGGGLIQTSGFGTILDSVLQEVNLPIQTLTPRLVTGSSRSIARGLLISAELEATSRPAQHAA
ncbi:MAG: hypothetical protein O3B13_24250 [Planctomycetota bacterium]|nr:hypothetical protein [Planctomycetota bacterium]MDA1166220.1 hypothetical protein [Planctomycetota bacterium]